MDCWTPNACLTSRDVTVTPNVGDESSVVSTRLRNSVDDEWSEWMPYLHQQPIPWELTQPDGRVSVEAEFMDEFGNTGIISSTPIVLDTTAPVGFISINDDQEWTTSEKVVLSVGATDAWPVIRFDKSRFRLGTLGNGNVPILGLDIPEWNRCKAAMSVQGRLAEHQSDIFGFDHLDSVPLTVISIDDDAEFTASGLVDLTILRTMWIRAGRDAASRRNDPFDWMPVADRQTWVLTGDRAPTWSKSKCGSCGQHAGSSDGIYLDNWPPEGQLVINDSSEMTQTASHPDHRGHDEGSAWPR